MPAPRIGCHLSLGNKPGASIAEAARHQVECLQIFASSPSAWKAPIVNPEREALTIRTRAVEGIEPLFIHASYLVNLASPDPLLAGRSRDSLVAALSAAERLGASAVITHLGSHLGRGFDAVSAQVGVGLRDVLARTPPTVDLVLENSAGSGGVIGSSLEELAELLGHPPHSPRLKIGLDTAHLCGAGWDFTQPGTAARLVERIHRTVGVAQLAVIHANDSKVPPGSRRDRHASVGEGHIGERGFAFLLAEPALTAVPWVCETPDLGSNDVDERFGSVRRLRRLSQASSSANGILMQEETA